MFSNNEQHEHLRRRRLDVLEESVRVAGRRHSQSAVASFADAALSPRRHCNAPNPAPSDGFTPGGATDLVGRLVAEKLSERFVEQVVVDNPARRERHHRRAAVGMRAARRPHAARFGIVDQYRRQLYTRGELRCAARLQPVAIVATLLYVMVIYPSIAVRTVAELVAYAKPRAAKSS